MSQSGIESLSCSVIERFDAAEWDGLAQDVRFRIVRGDEKGRPFGTPRNPHAPVMSEFNPQFGQLEAGHIKGKIGGQKHGPFPEQVARIMQLSNEELVRYRQEDPISGHPESGTFSITGGHHRLFEIIRRASTDELDPSTPIRILFHD